MAAAVAPAPDVEALSSHVAEGGGADVRWAAHEVIGGYFSEDVGGQGKMRTLNIPIGVIKVSV